MRKKKEIFVDNNKNFLKCQLTRGKTDRGKYRNFKGPCHAFGLRLIIDKFIL